MNVTKEKTLEALDSSIAKWDKLALVHKSSTPYSESCVLCDVFWNVFENSRYHPCGECPVAVATGDANCREFKEWRAAEMMWRNKEKLKISNNDWGKAARAVSAKLREFRTRFLTDNATVIKVEHVEKVGTHGEYPTLRNKETGELYVDTTLGIEKFHKANADGCNVNGEFIDYGLTGAWFTFNGREPETPLSRLVKLELAAKS